MNWKDYLNYFILSRQIIISLVFGFFFLSSLYAGESDSLKIGTDSLVSVPGISVSDSLETADTASVFEMSKSPWGAVLRSTILPGWGQLYNESYWKAPVVWGFLYYFVSVWIEQNDLYWKYARLYQQDQTNTTHYRFREFYHDQRDQFAVYIGLTILMNLVDAYVDAHLFDFDVSPDPLNNSMRLNFRVGL